MSDDDFTLKVPAGFAGKVTLIVAPLEPEPESAPPDEAAAPPPEPAE